MRALSARALPVFLTLTCFAWGAPVRADDGAAPAAAKLRVATRRWCASSARAGTC
jgi:hypothetical protein